jgi:HlyD family secretion protein
MDRVIEKPRRSPLQLALVGMAALAALLVAWQLWARAGTSRLKVDTSRMTTAVVEKGLFREYYPFEGRVEPATSVYLDVEGGGRVEQIFVEGGQYIEEGQLILKFSNPQAQRSAIETETRLLETLDIQRNTEFNRAQSTLLLQEQLLNLEHEINDVEAKFRRYDALMKNPNSPISQEEYELTRDQLKYLKDRRELMLERMRQEEIISARQLEQAKKSIVRLTENLGLLEQIVKSLEVRAPISGHLSTISAEVGQNIQPGQRIGQIDLLDEFKIRTSIDQAYSTRVSSGTTGHVLIDGRAWDVTVSKVYPEVQQNVFQADVVFIGEVPATLRRGQTVTVELSFSSPSESLIVARGGFYQHTAGRWVYLVAPDGRSARRMDVRLGRQNPRQVEVLEGLREGDRIVVSGYDTYNNVDELQFKEPL